MGSKSDLPVMQKAIDILTQFGVESEVKIVSAHRTPEMMFNSPEAKINGIYIIIAGAGGAAHFWDGGFNCIPSSNRSLTKSRNSVDGWTLYYQFYKCLRGSSSYCCIRWSC